MPAEKQPDSDITGKIFGGVRYLMGTSLEMQAWSGYLDWSKRLVGEGVLRSPELIEAFSEVKRVDFLPATEKCDEGYDRPIPIGHKQTNSQPSLVAQMLELLKPQAGHRILDVGSGSGWTAGLLGHVTGSSGRVVGTERIEELEKFSRENLSPYGFSWVSIEHTEEALGFAADAPYDRILVSAHMIDEWTSELTDQLSDNGGIMVAPIALPGKHGVMDYSQDVIVITKSGNEITRETAIKEIGFVPLVYEPAE